MILTYREGCSGSWLAELLTLGDKTATALFRQDVDGTNQPDTVMHFDGGESDKETILAHQQRYSNQQILTCHSANYKLLRQLYPNRRIIRIVPITSIFQCIASAYYKFAGPSYLTVNYTFEYIKDYYKIHTESDPRPTIEQSQVIDYGRLNTVSYINDMFCVELKPNQIKFLNEYWSLQKFVVSEQDLYKGISTRSLLEYFSKENTIFNLACFIFVYELINEITESQRLWSINDVPATLEELSHNMKYKNQTLAI
jgi:hypothetical protein